MSVVISNSLVLSAEPSSGGVINGNNPIIGWENLLTESNISASTEAEGFPATNLANPSTNLFWQGVESSPAADEYITIEVDTVDDIDYVGIARHNFGSAQIAVSVEVLDEDSSPPEWMEAVQETIPANDQPLILRFPPQPVSSIRIRLQPGSAAPQAAVVYVGKLLIVQRRIYVGHTPINYGRVSKVVNARSESGNFLGRIVLNQMTQTTASFSNLAPDWYRANFEPFLLQAEESPFFWAWRPLSYPNECGYCWLMGDAVPSNQLPNGFMQVSLEMSGIFE